MRTSILIIICILLNFFGANKAFATSPESMIASIEVKGNRKIEKDAILNKIKSKVGQSFDAEVVRQDILDLFNLGYFLDIQVDQSPVAGKTALTFEVVEKPSVAEIQITGNSEIKEEDIKEAAGVKSFEIYNEFKVKDAVEKIQKAYEDKGFYLTKIETKVEEVQKGESVKLVFVITEGEKVKVKKIILIGNKKLSDTAIKGKLFTQEEGYFTSLSSSGQYKQEAFERDVQIIRFLYYNQGYIQAKVDRPQVSVTPDKKGIYISIRVEEGEQYEVGEVDFAGDDQFSKSELYSAIAIDDNKIFAYDLLQKDMAELQAKYGDLGYAYANIIPRWSFNEPEKKVNLIFEIDKGEKVYFGQINFVGNSKTRDKVIRRELKIHEGELYNETRKRESLEGVQRLGFFEDVAFKTTTPPDRLNVMNVDLVIKERSTGQVQVSAGYSSAGGMTFGGSVQQTNFLGKGQNLGVSMNLTNTSSVYDISFQDPYYNDSLWSVGYRIFQSANSGRFDYEEKRSGGSVSLGHPLGEFLRASLSYGYTAVKLSPVYDRAGTNLTDYDLFPLEQAGDASTFTAAVEYDDRNDRYRPSKGIYGRMALAHSGLIGGNLKYYKASTDFKYYKNIFWDVVWRNYWNVSKVESTDPSIAPPFYELYLLGGPYSLRGYRFGQVGRRVFSKKVYDAALAATPPSTVAQANVKAMRSYGGTQQFQYMTELQFPLVKEAEMFGIVFYDIGQAEDGIFANALNSDWGIGMRWFSPIGPLRFEWGFPINPDPLYHETGSVFEFSIGTPF